MAIPGFLGTISGSGTLEVYKDSGITGNIIYPNQVNVHCLSGNCLIPFLLNCNVESENIYTLHFIPGTGIPDSFGK